MEQNPAQPIPKPLTQSISQEKLVDISSKPIKKSNKWFFIIVILLILSITGVTGYFANQIYQLKATNRTITPKTSPVKTRLTVMPTVYSTVIPSGAYYQTVSPFPTKTNFPLISINKNYFSVSYPNYWYEWSIGRGIDLDLYEIHTIPPPEGIVSDNATIMFDIQSSGKDDEKSIEEQKNNIQKLNQVGDNKNHPIVIIDEIAIDGITGLLTEQTIDREPYYYREARVIKNNIKYIIKFGVNASTIEKRDLIKNKYLNDFDVVLSSIKLH